MLFLVLPSLAAPAWAQTSSVAEGKGSIVALQEQKLRAETAEFETNTRNSSGLRGFFTTVAAPLTGLAAIAAIGISLIGFARERHQLREQQSTARHQQLEERFASVLLALGDGSEAIQAGAAVSLLNFLSEENRQFHQQVRSATLANLKVEQHKPTVMKLLVCTFEQALRVADDLRPDELDLSHAFLEDARLEGLTLDQAQLDEVKLNGARLCGSSLISARGRRAQLEKAQLTGEKTNLQNAQLYEVQANGGSFAGANLNNAHMENGDLRGANFRGARLQAAHLKGAQLNGAKFEGANVADTRFEGAKFDPSSLASLARAENWQKAHLSEEDKKLVEALAPPSPSSPEDAGNGEK